MNTTENNKLIAEFMGNKVVYRNGKYYRDLGHHQLGTLPQWHKDWNRLHEVIEKIESLNISVQIFPLRCVIRDYPKKFFDVLGSSKIEAVYNAVVEFIKFYNSAQKEN